MKNQLRTAYLYADGHAVLIYQKEDKHAGTIEWVEIMEKLGPNCDFVGRVILGNCNWNALFDLVKTSHRVRIHEPDEKQGSDNTKARHIRVGGITVEWKTGKSLFFSTFPDLISAPYTHQPEMKEDFDAELSWWSDRRVTAVHRVKTEQERVAA